MADNIDSLLQTLITRVDNIHETINSAVNTSVNLAVSEALKASESRVAHCEDRILNMQRQLDLTHKKYDDELKLLESRHNVAVRKLEHRLAELEYQQDNQEMRSRRWNVRIENIPFDGSPKEETDERLLEKIKEQCEKVGIPLADANVARYHRSSAPTKRDGTLQAQTIVKLSNWKARKLFQAANRTARTKKVKFFCSNDLTKRRHELLQYARGRIDRAMSAKFSESEIKERKIPEQDKCFTFSTPDGQLLVRIDGKMFPYETQEEFMRLFQNNFKSERGVLEEARLAEASSEPPKQQWLAVPISKPVRTDLSQIPDIPAWLADPLNIWVGRGNGAAEDVGFGNPFKIGRDGTREHVIDLYKKTCIPKIAKNDKLLHKLKNAKQILCGCMKNEPCHGDLLLELV